MRRRLSQEKISVPSTRSLFSVDHEDKSQQQNQQRASSSSLQQKARSSSSGSINASPLSIGLGFKSPSSTRTSSPHSSGSASGDNSTARGVEDEILGSIAQSALHQVKSMARNACLSGDWKECKATASELVYEQRTPTEFRTITKSLVPCTVDEISNVLSSEDSDQFNASMLELLGARYAFGVTLRTLATSTAESHLSIKAISLSKANPLSSTKHTVSFLDYVEADSEERSACRVVQTLRRRSKVDANDRQSMLGNVLIGYILQEDPEKKYTMVFFYATHVVKSTSDPSAALRPDTIARFRQLSQLSTKWVGIAMRRRLGAQKILDRESGVASSAQPQSCVVCAQTVGGSALLLLRKKHFCCLCGHFVCGSCSSTEEVEAHIGTVDKRRVCVDCSTRVNQQVFERETPPPPPIQQLRQSSDRDEDARPRFRQYTIV
ncbi:hypothetical protein Gpo141_00002818 [Globisporangium polare]